MDEDYVRGPTGLSGSRTRLGGVAPRRGIASPTGLLC